MIQSNLQTAEEIKNKTKKMKTSLRLKEWALRLGFSISQGDMSEIIEEVSAMESYASQSLPQQPVSAGLRWVKSSGWKKTIKT